MELTQIGGHLTVLEGGVHDAKESSHVPAAFREQPIELVWAGRTPEELSREFEPTAQTIHNWVAQAERDRGTRTDGLTSVERQELQRLSRELRQLKLE